jgi:hypothetical protein
MMSGENVYCSEGASSSLGEAPKRENWKRLNVKGREREGSYGPFKKEKSLFIL